MVGISSATKQRLLQLVLLVAATGCHGLAGSSRLPRYGHVANLTGTDLGNTSNQSPQCSLSFNPESDEVSRRVLRPSVLGDKTPTRVDRGCQNTRPQLKPYAFTRCSISRIYKHTILRLCSIECLSCPHSGVTLNLFYPERPPG